MKKIDKITPELLSLIEKEFNQLMILDNDIKFDVIENKLYSGLMKSLFDKRFYLDELEEDDKKLIGKVYIDDKKPILFGDFKIDLKKNEKN